MTVTLRNCHMVDMLTVQWMSYSIFLKSAYWPYLYQSTEAYSYIYIFGRCSYTDFHIWIRCCIASLTLDLMLCLWNLDYNFFGTLTFCGLYQRCYILAAPDPEVPYNKTVMKLRLCYNTVSSRSSGLSWGLLRFRPVLPHRHNNYCKSFWMRAD